jgi:hypothetical protein
MPTYPTGHVLCTLHRDERSCRHETRQSQRLAVLGVGWRVPGVGRIND